MSVILNNLRLLLYVLLRHIWSQGRLFDQNIKCKIYFLILSTFSIGESKENKIYSFVLKFILLYKLIFLHYAGQAMISF